MSTRCCASVSDHGLGIRDDLYGLGSLGLTAPTSPDLSSPLHRYTMKRVTGLIDTAPAEGRLVGRMRRVSAICLSDVDAVIR